jgi:hypothetical protein
MFGGWQLGGIERVASGFPIPVPRSNNNLGQLTFESTFVNRVPGVSPFLVDPNSHFNPDTTAVLNPAAWVDAAPGTWGTANAFYNDYRWRRVHDEEVNLAKTFNLGERVKFQLRGEFFNVFNRVSYPQSAPQSRNIAVPQTTPNSGFGRLCGCKAGAPRTGQIVGRITF